MASVNSLDAVKRKIQTLQQQADDAEDRAQVLQRQLDSERELREKVRQSTLYLSAPSLLSLDFLPAQRCCCAAAVLPADAFLTLLNKLQLPLLIDSLSAAMVPQCKALVNRKKRSLDSCTFMRMLMRPGRRGSAAEGCAPRRQPWGYCAKLNSQIRGLG